MRSKYRNIFFLFGLVAIGLMVWKFEPDYGYLWQRINEGAYWFLAVLLLWVFIYAMNALSWYQIINDKEKISIPFWKVYKYTVTGFALNYTTPMGLMGGEPYRIMELSTHVGVAKATSSVILYVMMHIFSHFWFWFFSIFIFVVRYTDKINLLCGFLLLVITGVCLLAFYLFFKGYKNGFAMKSMLLLTHVPYFKRWARKFVQEKTESIHQVDQQIAELHQKRKFTFYSALLLEFFARVIGCLEVYFILFMITQEVNFWDCILIQAFYSLFANALFFTPLQLGSREGGLAIITSTLLLNSGYGVITSLITRVREMIWIIIGILLMKVGNASEKPA